MKGGPYYYLQEHLISMTFKKKCFMQAITKIHSLITYYRHHNNAVIAVESPIVEYADEMDCFSPTLESDQKN